MQHESRRAMHAPASPRSLPPSGRAEIIGRFVEVRRATEALAAPLSAEDQLVQSMPDASPIKWHRAHTTWFFETFLLVPYCRDYRVFDPRFAYLFNSYYEAVGPRHMRPARGLVSRPSIDEIELYRAHVDQATISLADELSATMSALIELGINHEQQHQELMLTDIKHAFWSNPTRPVYRTEAASGTTGPAPLDWLDVPAGIHEIGHRTDGFCFDNEQPAHRALLPGCRIADRPVSVGEYLAFMADGGYERPEFWLSDGWATVQAEHWRAPLYWEPAAGGGWQVYGLTGTCAPVLDEPVCHVSHYEAAAYAAWAGKRLPTEFEYEVARQQHGAANSAKRCVRAHPEPLGHAAPFGHDVWEWTASAYAAYPGYRPATGAIGEYNGKFMSGQMVLRGRSCATPPGHDRPTYRNFFPPAARWQFSGFRLAEDA
jgi:ergothioneine biosynthesis protein EgtB